MNIFATLAGKIGGGIIILLTCICLILVYKNISKETDIVSLTAKVSEVSNRNSVLESQVASFKKQFEAANQSFGIQQEVLDKMSQNERETLAQLNKIASQGKNDETPINDDTPLPDDVIRVLTNHCNQVRGSACTDPY